MKQIFDVVLYLDFENDNEMNFYKYKILVLIVKYYRIGDIKIEGRALKSPLLNCNLGNMINKSNTGNMSNVNSTNDPNNVNDQISTKNGQINIKDDINNNLDEKKRKILQTIFIEDKSDTSNDNVLVLSNLIWENTLFLLDMFDEETLNNCLVDRDKIIETADPEYFEAFLIIELYTEIILQTGVFFQNRILRNIKTLSKFRKMSNFGRFIEVINQNFKVSTQSEKNALGLLSSLNN